LVKKNNGDSRNPETLRLDVDISYGDAMVSEFSIESPNKVNVIHYTGKNSKYDPDTKFAFTDNSLKDIVEFFNRLGYSLDVSDFKFIDSDDNSFHHNEIPNQLYVDKLENNK
jgi:hypothetical protein